MKRYLYLGFLFCFMLLFTGCSKVMDLTESEQKAISEYSAELLLKYDVAFLTKYYEWEKEERKNGAASTETSEAPTDTEAATEEATEAPTEPPAENPTEQPAPPEDSQEPTEAPAPDIQSETDIAKIAGISGVSIQFQQFQITDRYPAQDKNGDFMYLEAPDGMKLIVLEFQTKNLTSEPIDIDLLDSGLEYRIVMNGQKSAKPMLTILINDLSTYEATLAPNGEETTVLVFQIADRLVDQVESLNLKVLKNGDENIIRVK